MVISVLFDFILFCIKCIIGWVWCIFCWIFVIMCCCVFVGENGSCVSSLLISFWFIEIVIFGWVLDSLCIFNMFKWWDKSFFKISWYWVGCKFFFILWMLILGGGWCIVCSVLFREIWLLYMFFGSKLVNVFLFNNVKVCLVKLCSVSCFIFLVVG